MMLTYADAESFFFFGDLEAAELLDTQAHHTHSLHGTVSFVSKAQVMHK
jgi:hypothetical protein